MHTKIGDSSLQLSLSFNEKKKGETSFQMDPSCTSSTPSEMSVSWSEGGGSAEDQMEKESSIPRKMAARAKRHIRKTCTTNLLKRRLPMIEWLPKYTLQSLFHDCMAGFTVALTAIPQGIAYGAVAGVPVEVCHYKTNFKRKVCATNQRLYNIRVSIKIVWIVHSICGTVYLRFARLSCSNYYGSHCRNGSHDSTIRSAWRRPIRYNSFFRLRMHRVVSWTP